MSLFGDEPSESTQSSNKPKNSLFDEEAPAKPASGGLFANNDTLDKSPWDFVSPRKQQARGNLVKTLLSPNEVPESYIDAWNALLGSEYSSGLSSITIDGVQKLLSGSSITRDQQELILRTVAPTGATSFGRGEFCVLLALIGLAQEEEDATLDSVDDRRRRMRVPRPNSR